MYTLKCCCGHVDKQDTEEEAQKAALSHMEKVPTVHALTCTRPAHNHPGSVPIIVFIASSKSQPKITLFGTRTEIYRLDAAAGRRR